MRKKILAIILVTAVVITGFLFIKKINQPDPTGLEITEHDGYTEIRGQ